MTPNKCPNRPNACSNGRMVEDWLFFYRGLFRSQRIHADTARDNNWFGYPNGFFTNRCRNMIRWDHRRCGDLINVFERSKWLEVNASVCVCARTHAAQSIKCPNGSCVNFDSRNQQVKLFVDFYLDKWNNNQHSLATLTETQRWWSLGTSMVTPIDRCCAAKSSRYFGQYKSVDKNTVTLEAKNQWKYDHYSARILSSKLLMMVDWA